MKNLFSIKELLIDEENPELGIHAISIVDDPAIEVPFLYFNKGLLPFWKWTAYPEEELLDNSHEFCKEHAFINKDRVYHTSEIQEWGKLSKANKDIYKFIPESNFFETFDDNVSNFNGDQQIFNCRHYLLRVDSINEVPKEKRHMLNMNKEYIIEFRIDDEEKRIIKGLCLQSGQFIFRNDVGNGHPGYVYLSRDTIRKLKEKYGYNRSLTFQHRDDITGNAILMKSWIEEDDINNRTKWFMEYKILPTSTGDKLWNIIKANDGACGFSIEAIFKI